LKGEQREETVRENWRAQCFKGMTEKRGRKREANLKARQPE